MILIMKLCCQLCDWTPEFFTYGNLIFLILLFVKYLNLLNAKCCAWKSRWAGCKEVKPSMQRTTVLYLPLAKFYHCNWVWHFFMMLLCIFVLHYVSASFTPQLPCSTWCHPHHQDYHDHCISAVHLYFSENIVGK